jgi:hypothetical protein
MEPELAWEEPQLTSLHITVLEEGEDETVCVSMNVILSDLVECNERQNARTPTETPYKTLLMSLLTCNSESSSTVGLTLLHCTPSRWWRRRETRGAWRRRQRPLSWELHSGLGTAEEVNVERLTVSPFMLLSLTNPACKRRWS